MALKLISGPAVEPFSVTQARLHLRETTPGADIDAKIAATITAVRELCENDCRRAFVNRQYKLTIPSFPRPGCNVPNYWRGLPLASSPPDGVSGYEIYLPMPPLASVDAVSYIGASGAPVSMNVSTDIAVSAADEPASILPVYGSSWPGIQLGSQISITFTAGYGPDASTVPQCAIAWMMAMLGAIYTIPVAEMTAYRETLIVPQFIDRLLDPVRYRRY